MRVFARFDQEGNCQGFVQTSDPNFPRGTQWGAYEEIIKANEKQLVLSGRCKKTIDQRGQRIIVLA